jgi:uncharacterized coiled-coil protein SlyX
MTPPKLPRMQSQTERDMSGLAAKREREAAPFEVEPEITGNYTGPELAEMRATRRPETRMALLEEKQDRDREAHHELVSVVSDLRVDVAKMSVKLDALPQLVAMLTADKADALDARKHGRERVTKIIGGLFSAGVLAAIVGWILS